MTSFQINDYVHGIYVSSIAVVAKCRKCEDESKVGRGFAPFFFFFFSLLVAYGMMWKMFHIAAGQRFSDSVSV